jgi:hypothetical protein
MFFRQEFLKPDWRCGVFFKSVSFPGGVFDPQWAVA